MFRRFELNSSYGRLKCGCGSEAENSIRRALYHILNRGNYRAEIPQSSGVITQNSETSP